MDREKIGDFLPYMKAFAEGKTMQLSDNRHDWYDADDNCINFEYLASCGKHIRVKPEYRPYKSKDECAMWNPLGYVKDSENVYSILAINDNGIRVMAADTGENFFYPFEYAFKNFTTINGYPFGLDVARDDR